MLAFSTGLYVTRQLDASPDRSRAGRLSFDLCRMGLIWTLGDTTVALAQWIDPVTMGSVWNSNLSMMATATLMLFFVHMFAWMGFFFFQWQTLKGKHPWDMPGRHPWYCARQECPGRKRDPEGGG